MSAASDENQATDQWREEGPWLLLLVLPLAALAFRRGWVFVAVLAVLPLSQPAEASLWENLWLNKDQQALKLLEEGEPGAAAEVFRDGEWQAVARYRDGDFADSAAKFAERGDARNLYNLGNAMAMQGEFETAIDAYEQVLELQPDNEDAAYNRDLLRQLQEQQEQQQQQGDSQETSEESGGDSEESDSENPSDQQADSDSQSDSEGEESDPSQRAEDEGAEQDLEALQEELQRAAEQAEQEPQEVEQQLTEEQLEALRRAQEEQQAMEQWLRRIPNDPGGLLRRKFRYQYQRMGKDQDGNNLWPDDEVQPW